MGQSFKINKSNVKEILSLTPMQEGMLFHFLQDPNSEEYFEQLSLNILGEINLEVFRKAWDFVVSKNEMLRALFRWDKLDKPVQIILKEHQTRIVAYDFCCDDISKSIEKLNEIRIKDKNNKFDLSEVPFRVTLCKLEKGQYEMIITNHHILFDGWSTGIILQDFLYAYDKLSKNESIEKVEAFRIGEFIKYINQRDKRLENSFWKNYFINFEEDNLIQMKLDETTIRKLEQYNFSINQDFIKNMDKFVKDNKVTFAEIIYCAWGILLQKYKSSRDIVFGTTISGRNIEIKGLENAVGLFINTLPLRIENSTNKNISQLLEAVKNSVRQREPYETTSLIDIKKYRDINGRKDLFDSLVVVENYPLTNLLKNKERLLQIRAYAIEEQTNYALMLSINILENLNFTLTYDSSIMTKEYITNMSEHFINILKSIIEDCSKNIDQIDILTEQERNQILYEFNNTKDAYPKDKTIHQLFEEQVEKTPDNIAVEYEDKSLTYRELNVRANQLARVFRRKGITLDNIVGIMVERSFEMIIGIMGILKAGAAYLPIDPEYPQDRIDYILQDSGAKLLLTQSKLSDKISITQEILVLDDSSLYTGNNENLDRINKRNDLAYVIYTSGSTGKPKGAMIEHYSLVNRINWMQKQYPINESDAILQKTTYAFDVSVWELLWWSQVGAKVCMLVQGGEKDPAAIVKAIEKHKITTMHFVPSMLSAFTEHLYISGEVNRISSLRQVFASGEALTLKNVEQFNNLINKNCGASLINLYGPTEATVDVTYFDCTPDPKLDMIPIGKPISNIRLYIIDKNKKLQPIGVAGELCIAGDGLARGYLNRPELTAEKFVDNPFGQGVKMYKTGDLARWKQDGNIEFLGRIDHQVKIRGFRIELGEIENKLLAHEAVKEAVVVAREDNSRNKYLCAYLVGDIEQVVSELREHLSTDLPYYMIPSYFVQLERLPHTSNGKIDRKALPEPNGSISTGKEYEAPRNSIEELLAVIWKDILKVEKLSINDSFFDLGGHSLKATVLISKIHKELNVEISLKELFRMPTIKELSRLIKSIEKNPYSIIEKSKEKEFYETSSGQKRMYMLQQFEKDSTAYNMSAVFILEGNVNREKIENTFRQLVSRHEILRTYFGNHEDQIVQKVDSSYEFKLIDRSCDEEIESIANHFIKPFELEKAPLFRAELIKNREESYLLIDMHHIISDGMSMDILIREFRYFYNGKNVEPLKLQYKDFAAWQNNFLKSEKMKKQEEYWTNKFSDEIPVLNMPTDYGRPTMKSFEGDSVSFKIDEKLTNGLRKLTRETGTTMHMVLQSAFSILLSKYSGQEDIVIGTPIAGRPNADLYNIIGMFVNTLPLRNKPEGNKKYLDFLKEVKENSLVAYENQSYQFETLVEKLNIRRDTSRNPLFDVMFIMTNTVSYKEISLDDLLLKKYWSGNEISKFDLTMNAIENDDELSSNISYCTKLFRKETIDKLSNHYIKILTDITNCIDIQISEIEILTEQEKNQILYEFNNTNVVYPIDKTIQELFEERVLKGPNNTAVVFENKRLTYRELNEKANSLARVLRNNGIKTDSIVGIMVDRSIEMIVGILGILKAGGAYLPIDPKFPKDRMEFILKDSDANILLTMNKFVNSISVNASIIALDDDHIYIELTTNLDIINNSNNLVYVIYTSGTTGKPKGVMIQHYNLVNYITFLTNKAEITNKDKTALVSSYAFDLGYTSLFSSLLSGAELHVLPNDICVNAIELLRYIYNNQITYLKLTPSLLSAICNTENTLCEKSLRCLRLMILGGEQINVTDVETVHKMNKYMQIMNHYGPTETTVGVTTHAIDFKQIEKFRQKPVIGRPISNNRIYIVNKRLKLVPIGVPGELCVTGDGVSRGYINNAELTAFKLVKNPFEQGSIMYKTGDLARWIPNGEIELLGRIDNQVKIRGYRVELGEIENRILQFASIKQVVVVKKEKANQSYLCAYLVSDKLIDIFELKKFLINILSDYMIPVSFIQIDKVPLTSNGKIDKIQLPEPDVKIVTYEYNAPQNAVQEKLANIWGEVLGINKVSINDNFFELGGHSLSAIVLLARIHKELNIEIPLKELFRTPTISGLNEFISSSETNSYIQISRVEQKEYYETSPAQKRMYILQQFKKDNVAYNMPVVFELEGEIDREKIEDTFNKLARRHEMLRTYFEIFEDTIMQRINNSADIYLKYRKDCGKLDDLVHKFIKPFELDKAPLLRAEVLENVEKTYLLIDMHHIISDGVSRQILMQEFKLLYEGKQLAPLSIKYKDFAEWQNRFLQSKEMKRQKDFWINRFNDQMPTLNMPYDYERPAIKSFDGDSIRFVVDEYTTQGLKILSKDTGSTMFMIHLSALNILLSKYTGHEDIIIGIPVSGRMHSDLEQVIGMFVNTLALRNKPCGEKNYLEFLEEVKNNSLMAYENQSYQLEELVNDLHLRRDTSRNPLFDVILNVVNIVNGTSIHSEKILLKMCEMKSTTSKVDISLTLLEGTQKHELILEYCTKLFNKETIDSMIDDYTYLLNIIVKNRDILLCDIILKHINRYDDYKSELTALEEEFNF